MKGVFMMNKKLVLPLCLLLVVSLTACSAKDDKTALETPVVSKVEDVSSVPVAPEKVIENEKDEPAPVQTPPVPEATSTSVVYIMTNPEKVEYFGESPTFIISYRDTSIQIEFTFTGPDTYAFYEVSDTTFSGRPEVVSFSPDASGNGVSESHGTVIELQVAGDLATLIFHYETGEASEPITFKRLD